MCGCLSTWKDVHGILSERRNFRKIYVILLWISKSGQKHISMYTGKNLKADIVKFK